MTRQARVEWMTVSRAARVSGTSERTIEQWIAEKMVESRLVSVGQREVRLLRRDTLPGAPLQEDLPREDEGAPSSGEPDGVADGGSLPESRLATPDGDSRPQ